MGNDQSSHNQGPSGGYGIYSEQQWRNQSQIAARQVDASSLIGKLAAVDQNKNLSYLIQLNSAANQQKKADNMLKGGIILTSKGTGSA